MLLSACQAIVQDGEGEAELRLGTDAAVGRHTPCKEYKSICNDKVSILRFKTTETITMHYACGTDETFL